MLGSGASGSGGCGRSGLPFGCWFPSLAIDHVPYCDDHAHHLEEQARQLQGDVLSFARSILALRRV